MLCDSHIHFIPKELSVHTSFYKGAWTDSKALCGFLDKYSIEKALLVYPSTDAHLKLKSRKEACSIYNKAASGLMLKDKRIVAAGIIDVTDIDAICPQLEELKEKGLKGLSIASSYEGRFIIENIKVVFKQAYKHNLFVFVHPQTLNPIGFERVKDPLLMPVLEYSFDISMLLGLLMMEGLLKDCKAKIIFSSLGGVTAFLKDRFDRVYMMLRKRDLVKDLSQLPSQLLKNVYVDTSGSSLENIQLAMDLFGEDKILWGSDYPVNINVEENLKLFDKLKEEERKKIIYENLMRLLEQ
ncbi:MAG: amidohydrolase family protein [Candidatus Omnitrophica bacterium]|nr:amidohydrolase family protein [Candidatus Omnitrophota bacterium]